MNVGSLFSGIGGMDAGLARAGHRHVFFCEADAWRREVLAARWPGVPVYADVRDVDESLWERDGLGRHGHLDLLCGGFPCQDLSVAGKRAGLAGERSGLFFEYARIIDAFQPGWVLVENVPGLLSSNGGRDFGVVLGTLADLGYGLAWRVLDSRFFGVPQRRRRVFIVGAVAHGDPAAAARRAGQVLSVGSRCPGHPATRSEARQDAPDAPVSGTLGGRRGFTGDDIDRGGHTSLSGLGNGGPDDNDAQAGRLIAETLREHPRPGSNSNGQIVAHTLRSEGFDASEDGTGRGTPIVAAPLTKGSATGEGVNAPGRRQEDDVNLVVAPPLVSRSSRGRAQGNSPGHNADSVVAFHPTGGGAKGLSPTDDLAPGTGTGDGGTVAISFTTRGRAGEAATEAQTDGLHPALRAGRGGGRRDSGIAGPELGVRRLTPIECERLQGLPDGWTDLGDTPDSRRYSALGDAVTANVAEWIGSRLGEAEREREAA